MLTHDGLRSAKDAADYYFRAKFYSLDGKSEHLCGWYGKGSEILGLEGKVEREQFEEILKGKIDYHGKNIELGIKLNGQEDLWHDPGTDFTFNVPKSVSNQANMEGGDLRINEAIIKAAKITFDYIEKNYVFTRIKENGKLRYEQVDNVVGSYFMENLNRDNEFHNHVHFVFANMVRDKEGKWRSAEFKKIVDNEIYLGSVFRTNLAYELVKLGYEIEVTDQKQNFFQIKGSNGQFTDFTSQRTKKIVEKALEINPGSKPNSKVKQLANLLTREKKVVPDLKKLTDIRVKEFFKRTGYNIIDNISELTNKALSNSNKVKSIMAARHAVGKAISSLSERSSAFTEKQIIEKAIKFNMGEANIDHINKQIERFNKKGLLIDGQLSQDNKAPEKAYTTRYALEREKATIELMKRGQKALKPIISKKKADNLLKELNEKLPEKGKLNEGQLQAAKAILTSKDRIHGIQGYAGTGKTYMLQKVQEILDIVNTEELKKNPDHIPYELRGLAPSGPAVKELQKKGIKSGTLQGFIKPLKGYAEGRGSLTGIEEEKKKYVNKIFVTDEISMVEAEMMQDFLVIAAKFDLRTPLMGDIRQLPSVGAGSPAFELQRHGMSLVKMTSIRRQQNQIGKAIAYSAYARDFSGIFEKVGTNLLDCQYLKERENERLDAIEKELGIYQEKDEKEEELRNRVYNSDTALAATKLYFSFDAEKRDKTLIVCQSNATKDLVNEFIRDVLKSKELLSGKAAYNQILINENPTLAEKQIISTYQKEEDSVFNKVILFNKANKNLNIEKNEYFEIVSVGQETLKLRSYFNHSKVIEFNPLLANSYRNNIELYRQEQRDFYIGDKIMFTRKIEDKKTESLKDVEVKKEDDIVNSTLGVIKEVKDDSYVITIGNNDVEFKKNSPALKHIEYSYCRTTHKAQGATEHTSILITESWWKHLTEERNLLVQATRHSDDIYMVVDNKDAVIERIIENLGKKNDTVSHFLRNNDQNLLRKEKLRAEIFEYLGSNTEYKKYQIAQNLAKKYDTQKKYLLNPEEEIPKHLRESENINNKPSAFNLVFAQKDEEILKLENIILRNQIEELKGKNQQPVQKTAIYHQKNTRPKSQQKPKYTAKKTANEFERDYPEHFLKAKFKEQIYSNFSSYGEVDFSGIDNAIDRAFTQLHKPQYFGKKSKGYLLWHGKVGGFKFYNIANSYTEWGTGHLEKELSSSEKDQFTIKKLSKEEIAKKQKEHKEALKKTELEKKQAEEKLSIRSTKKFNNLSEKNRIKDKNKYLAKKGIAEYYQNKDIKFRPDGSLVIPAKDINGKIWTLQTIEEHGRKAKPFEKAIIPGAGATSGRFFTLNEKSLKNGANNVILAEGFATAASIDKAINTGRPEDKKIPIIICFSAGNIEQCLKNLKSAYPDKNFTIAADNDFLKPFNTGEKAAINAAKKYGASVILPKFTSLTHKEKGSNDFNDLHIVEGLEQVKKQFATADNYKHYKAEIELHKPITKTNQKQPANNNKININHQMELQR